MITHRWVSTCSAEDRRHVEELLGQAARFDAEAGFSTARPDAPLLPGAHRLHLLVEIPPRGQRGSELWDRLPEDRVIGYATLDVVDGIGSYQLVVAPSFRSLGVATLLHEQLRDSGQGWGAVPQLAYVAGWAHGPHPAAERLARRFGARTQDLVVKLVVDLDPRRAPVGAPGGVVEAAVPVVSVATQHEVAVCAADREAFGTTDRAVGCPGGPPIRIGRPVGPARRALIAADSRDGVGDAQLVSALSTAVAQVWSEGARGAAIFVPVDDEQLLRCARLAGLSHDQSDLRYVLRSVARASAAPRA